MTIPFGRYGRGVRRERGAMNKLETEYADILAIQMRIGQILWWEFEPIKLRLADKTYYTPDFMVMLANGEIEVRETKGFWEDDARVKIKCAAEKFPFRFVALSKDKSGWKHEEF